MISAQKSDENKQNSCWRRGSTPSDWMTGMSASLRSLAQAFHMLLPFVWSHHQWQLSQHVIDLFRTHPCTLLFARFNTRQTESLSPRSLSYQLPVSIPFATKLSRARRSSPFFFSHHYLFKSRPRRFLVDWANYHSLIHLVSSLPSTVFRRPLTHPCCSFALASPRLSDDRRLCSPRWEFA